MPRLDIVRRPSYRVPARSSVEQIPKLNHQNSLINNGSSPLLKHIQITELNNEQSVDWFDKNHNRINFSTIVVGSLLIFSLSFAGFTSLNFVLAGKYKSQNQVLAKSIPLQKTANESESRLPVYNSKSDTKPTLNDESLSTLLAEFSESHSGIYGVSFIDSENPLNQASYNGTKTFTAASTYKLFVAYSTLKRVEDGVWQWSDQIAGRDLSQCLDDMIVKSDNNCGAALLTKIGHRNITNEAKAIGCQSTSFVGKENITTTPNDLALLMQGLQTGKILNQQSNRDLLIGLLKRNIYRKGIPTGVSEGEVADKVGFMNGLLHDASIVYSPSGTYILVIMSDGSSWQNIAELASEIESQHTDSLSIWKS